MAIRQLEDINASGELVSVKKGGATADDELIKLAQVGNVDNTSDADKPVSTDTQAALDLKDDKTAPVHWLGRWAMGSYLKNDMVTDDDWLMIANKNTQERASPQPSGEPFWFYDGTLTSNPVTARQVIFGNRYDPLEAGYLSAVRINVIAGNFYQVYYVEDPLGTPIHRVIVNFTASTTGWTSFNISDIVFSAGQVMDFYALVNEPDPTPTTFDGNWVYSKPQNFATPASGTIVQATSSITNIHVHKIDEDSGDRSTALEGLTPGDIIESHEVRWAIQKVTDNSTYMTYQISPAIQDPDTGSHVFTFETVASTPITTEREVDYWLGTSHLGFFIADGEYGDVTPNATAQGIDVAVQPAVIPVDWDPVVYSVTPATEAGISEAQAINSLEYQTHRVIYSAAPLGPSLTKAEIVASLISVGETIEEAGGFTLTDGTNTFLVTRIGLEYYYERLTKA